MPHLPCSRFSSKEVSDLLFNVLHDASLLYVFQSISDLSLVVLASAVATVTARAAAAVAVIVIA
jgi:uncharacterized protein YejL (UPF0352 family)